jgi:diguanylate cyclase (GGDEF)-like protein
MKPQALIFAYSIDHLDALAAMSACTGQFESVLRCRNEQELMAALEEKSVDIIFSSARRDHENDLLWLKDLSKRDAWKDIQVMVFTEEYDVDNRVAALELGADDALSFRVARREIEARVSTRLRARTLLSNLRKARADLARMALTDSLTGLCNRAFFDVSLESEAARSARTNTPFSLLLIDVDHFKWINDTYGHQLGDTVLQAIARVLRQTVRKSDMAFRYGGEEFALVLPDTPIPSARILAERVHSEIAELARGYSHFRQPLTVSVGISCASGDLRDPHLLIEQADCALYAAKRNGRNRTEIFHLDSREDFSRSSESKLPLDAPSRMTS